METTSLASQKASTSLAKVPSHSDLENPTGHTYRKILTKYEIPDFTKHDDVSDSSFEQNLSEKDVTNITESLHQPVEERISKTQQEAAKVDSLASPKEISSSVQKTPSSSWDPVIENLQTQNQRYAITSRIASLRNSAITAGTNMKNFSSDVTPRLTQNATFITQVNEWMNKAMKMGGGNYSLVQSYKDTLFEISPFLKEIPQLKASADFLFGAFARIEAKADEIAADVRFGVTNFEQSVVTHSIINDFSKATNSLKSLITLLENSKTEIATHIDKMDAVITQSKKRLTLLQSYLKDSNYSNLYLKDIAEFKSEVALLEQNIQFLEQYQPKLKSSEKARASLSLQLKELLMFISELNQVHLQFVIGEYQAAKGRVQGLQYNNRNIVELFDHQ